MWTKAQVRDHQKSKATAAKLEAPIAKLEEMAKASPAFAERVKELRQMRDELDALSSIALAVDPEGE